MKSKPSVSKSDQISYIMSGTLLQTLLGLHIIAVAVVAAASIGEVRAVSFSPTQLDLGSERTASFVRAVPTAFGVYRARLSLSCYGVRYRNFDLEAEYSSTGTFTGKLWPLTLPPCDASVKKNLKKSKVDHKAIKDVEASYLQSLGINKKDVVKVAETVSLELKEINGNSVPIVAATALFQSDTQVASVNLELDGQTSEPILMTNALGFHVQNPNNRQRRSGDSEEDDSSDNSEEISTVCAEGVGGNPLTGPIYYGAGPNETCLPVVKRGNTCSLYIAGIGQVRSGQGSPKGCLDSPVITYPCNEGLTDTANGADSAALDALSGVYSLTTALRQLGADVPLYGPVDICVHFGQNQANAMWTGLSILLGDGFPGGSYPLVTPDVVSHEYCHMLTSQWSSLLLQGESGALNDGFSDACGQLLKEAQGGATWTVGDDVFYDVNGPRPIRYFQDPTLDGVSIDNAADFTSNLNSHQSSGMFNRIFYCLAEEKGVGVYNAFKTYLVANQIRWRPDTGLEDGACAIAYSAFDLGLNTTDVVDCCNGVGLLQEPSACPLDTDYLQEDLGVSREVTVSSVQNPVLRRIVQRDETIVIRVPSSVSIDVSQGQSDGPVVARSSSGVLRLTLKSKNTYYFRVRTRSQFAEPVRVSVSSF